MKPNKFLTLFSDNMWTGRHCSSSGPHKIEKPLIITLDKVSWSPREGSDGSTRSDAANQCTRDNVSTVLLYVLLIMLSYNTNAPSWELFPFCLWQTHSNSSFILYDMVSHCGSMWRCSVAVTCYTLHSFTANWLGQITGNWTESCLPNTVKEVLISEA